jgi:dienelactone hydrolase
MNRVLPLVFCVVASLPAQTALYEEDLQASRPYREANYHEFAKYIATLERQGALRLRFMQMIGYPAPGFYEKAGEPRIVKVGEDEIGTYYRLWIPVAPGVETYGLYIVPKKAKLPAPLVISLHGGGGIPESALFHGGSNYHDQIRGAVEQGYVVWAPLFVMQPFADRNLGSEIPAEVRKDLDAKLRQMGTSLMGMEVTKITRALDRILERKEVDPSRVAMIGLSYGGYYTLYISAVEPRIKVAIASCSFRATPAATDGVTEGRPIDISSPDQVGLLAPRPLQIQVGIKDKLAPIETVRQTAIQARRRYEEAGRPELFDYEEFDGGHEWRGAIAWPFLARHLQAAVAPPFPGKQSEWQGFPRYDFEFAGKTVTVVTPAAPAEGRPWLWRGEFFGAFATVDAALVKLGWHVVYIACPNTFGSPDTMERWARVYDDLTRNHGFSRHPVLLGMSRGGLYVYNWAAANPDKVGLIYGDAPVCDVKSWPGGKGKGQGSARDWDLFKQVYGLSEQQALQWTRNPIDILEPIARTHIPVLHVVGDADDVVPVAENTTILKQRLEALGGHVELIVKRGVGHHPHSLQDPTPIVDYILRNRIRD